MEKISKKTTVFSCKILPHPRWNTGREASEINRVKIARARPDRFWPAKPFFGVSVCLSVCLCVDPVCRPKFGSALGKSPSALCSFERRSPKSSTCRRGVDVTATLLALLRHKSRRRRAPRPDAGPPTHAIAGTRARAVTMATVRPPSLLNHSRRLASCRAPRQCHLDAAVVTRRRRRVTSFAFPSGGAPTGASLHLRLPLRRRRPGAEYADSIYGTDCADCGPRFPPPPPICAETCNWASDADCDDGGPGFRPALGRRHCGPDHRLMW